MKRIAVVGTGYVGLVAGTCLADFGGKVICVDNNEEKIKSLKDGKVPIYEPGLADLIDRNTYYKRLEFTTDIKNAVEDSEVIFIAVGTPPSDDGSADLKYVIQVATDIATHMNGYKVIVDKSTVPIGTGQLVKSTIREILIRRGVEYSFDVVSNPEFLREGSAIHDFTHPDRVVIGSESERATQIMKEVYRVLYLNETPFIETNIETSEIIKYASNAFLAMKITYMNEIANLCEKIGANVQHVSRAMGMDGRISPKFLHPGPGYGGSCFPKDTKALVSMAKKYGENISLIEATVDANEKQKLRMVKKIVNKMGDLKGRTIGVLGITFKPNTDDMREAPSLVILPELVKRGAALKVFDPQGEIEGTWRFKEISESIEFCKDEYQAMEGSEAALILTEWNQFRQLDFGKMKQIMAGKYFFDFRNIYTREYIESKDFIYEGVGV